MNDLRTELASLRRLRRHVMLQTAVALTIPIFLVFLLWDVRLVVPDARALAAIAAGLFSWVVVRTVADVAGALESCLLYTSPSPRDQRGSRMPSSA